MANGWFTIHRKYLETPFWLSEKFTRGQAWIDLIYLAAFEPSYFFIRGIRVDVQRGQVAWSEPKLAERWKWSRNKLRNFLKLLEKEQQIKQQKNNVIQIVTIINYDLYQTKGQQTEQQAIQQTEQQKVQQKDVLEINKRTKQSNNYKNILLSEIKISDFPDLNKRYFDIAVKFQQLIRNNIIESGAKPVHIDKTKGEAVDTIRLLIENDKYSVEDIAAVYQFLPKSEFWRKNILSIGKVREKFDKLIIAAKSELNGKEVESEKLIYKGNIMA